MHARCVGGGSNAAPIHVPSLGEITMKRVARWLLSVLAVGVPAWPASVAAQQAQGVEAVAWLTGCWEASAGERRTREVWMAPDGGLMVGMSRSVRGARATGFEFLLLGAREAGLVYRAHPSGQTPTDFPAVRVADGELVVANPEHDFPKRISYRIVAPDSLHAEVFGEAEGGEPAFVLRYARVSCEN